MQNSGIYCIENLMNNKKYIGQSKHLNRRKYQHIRELKGNYHFNEYLQRSFNKYGIKNFQFIILERCNESLLDQKEMYYIKKYNTMNIKKGYNLRAGGHKPKLSEISKLKISKTRMERIAKGIIAFEKHEWTEKQKERASQAQVKSYKNNPKIKIKISKSHTNLSLTDIKKIKQLLYLDMNIIEIVDIFNINIGKVRHIETTNTFTWVCPKLNYYIKNRYKIDRLKKEKNIMRMYREGRTYQYISDNNSIDIRSVIRKVNKFKTDFDNRMRENSQKYKTKVRCNKVKMLNKIGRNTVQISQIMKMGRKTVSKILKGNYEKKLGV